MSGKIHILDENEDLQTLISDLETPEVNITSENSYLLKDEGLIIDKAAYHVYLDGEKIAFPKKEFELLLLLASNPRKVFKREDILYTIWGKDFKAKDSRSLDVHIRMLRRKLNDAFITTIRGVGYKLEK